MEAGSDTVQVVREALDGLAKDGVDGMLRRVHPDFEMRTPARYAAEPDTYHGHDGIRRWFDSFYEVMDRVGLEGEDYDPVGDRHVAATMRIVARGGTTGIELTQQIEVLCEVVDGKIRTMSFFETREEALAAA